MGTNKENAATDFPVDAVADRVPKNGHAQIRPRASQDAEDLKTETSPDALLPSIIYSLGTFKHAYAEIIKTIDKQNLSEKLLTVADYQDLMEAWEAEEPVGHGPHGEFRLQFRDTVTPIWALMERTEEALLVRSVRDENAHLILTRFQELPFVKNFEHCIRRDPFRTLQGIEALLALLQAAVSAKERVSAGEAQGQAGSKPRPVKRNTRYEAIDRALREAADARPKSHAEVFRFLDSRNVRLPNREPFKAAGGWLKGFGQNRYSASAWLSQAWGRLSLPPFPRGPKK